MKSRLEEKLAALGNPEAEPAVEVKPSSQDDEAPSQAETPEPLATKKAAGRSAAPRTSAERSRPTVSKPKSTSLEFSIQPAINPIVLSEAIEAIESAKRGGDYRIQSLSDLVRAAIDAAISEGLGTLEPAPSGGRKRIGVLLTAEQYRFYEDLPKLSRGEIIERTLLTFLRHHAWRAT